MTNLEHTLQFELDRRNAILDAILNSMFADEGGELYYVGGGEKVPLDNDDADLICEAFELLEDTEIEDES